MKSQEERIAEMEAMVAERTDGESLTAWAFVTWAGGLSRASDAVVRTAVPLVGLFKDRKAKQEAGGMPRNMLAVVTPTRVLFYEFGSKGMKMAVKDLVRAVSRDGLVVTASKGQLGNLMDFQPADGNGFRLDSTTDWGANREVNDRFYAALGVEMTA